jgi:Domain of unknown function (DUF4286)
MRSMERKAVRYVVFTWIPEPLLPEWNDWHNHVHIPRVLAAPQMRGVRKLRVVETTLPGEWRPQYVTIYRLESLEAFESYRTGPGVELRAEYEARYGAAGKIARLVMVEEESGESGA